MTARAEPNDGDGQAISASNSFQHAISEYAASLVHGFRGPYGCFDFDDAQPHQIWVGAGIGITPFIARMKQRATTPDAKTIDLFHPTAEFEQAAIDRLAADAKAAGVRLHVLVNGKGGRLNGERIRAVVPEWQSASIWFLRHPPGGGSVGRWDRISPLSAECRELREHLAHDRIRYAL